MFPATAGPAALFCAVSTLLAAGGCASKRPPVADGYRTLRIHEADLSRAEAARAQAECVDQSTHAEMICRASRALCDVATELAESDAALRCEDARRRCTAAQSTAQRCDGDGDHP